MINIKMLSKPFITLLWLSICLCLFAGNAIALSYITFQGTVKAEILSTMQPVSGAVVQVTISPNQFGGKNNTIEILETVTYGSGSWSMGASTNGATQLWVTIEMFHNEYRGNKIGPFPVDTTANPAPFNLEMHAIEGERNNYPTLGLDQPAAGFRMSYYGLTNGNNQPQMPTIQKVVESINTYENILKTNASMNNAKSTYVLIVTQTDIGGMGAGAEWGNTYILWDEPDMSKRLGKPFVYDQASAQFPEGIDWHAAIDYINQNDPNGEVYIQVEPGLVDDATTDAESMERLLEAVLDEFVGDGEIKRHDNIVGIGIDLEWYRFATDMANSIVDPPAMIAGNEVSGIKARRWERLIRKYDSNLKMFLKHWAHGATGYWDIDGVYQGTYKDYAPTDAYTSAIFINDSQDFDSWELYPGETYMGRMLQDFDNWVTHYNTSDPVFTDGWSLTKSNWNSKPRRHSFQIGYPNDLAWWKYISSTGLEVSTPQAQGALSGLPINIDNHLRQKFPALNFGYFWVDFGMNHQLVFPNLYN